MTLQVAGERRCSGEIRERNGAQSGQNSYRPKPSCEAHKEFVFAGSRSYCISSTAVRGLILFLRPTKQQNRVCYWLAKRQLKTSKSSSATQRNGK